MPDTRKRSLIKGIMWRSIAVVASFTVAYLVTGGLTVSLELTVIGNAVSATLYYFHERFWAGIGWGKI